MSDKWLVCGLGNPEPEYDLTRHNFGFMVIDGLAVDYEIPKKAFKEKKKALVADAVYESSSLLLVKPLTYMNASGDAVAALLSYYKIEQARLIILVDDIDLPFGQIRIRENGSAGTHNGLKSVTAYLGKDYIRVRLGVKNEHLTKENVIHFVLGKFSQEEQNHLIKIAESAAEAVEDIISHGVAAAMNKWNGEKLI